MSGQLICIGAHPRNPRKLLWLPIREFSRPATIIGETGSGKSNLGEHIIAQFIVLGHGCGLIDPKGDTADDLIAALSAMPEESWPALARDLIIIDPADPACTARFNPLEPRPYGSQSRQRSDTVTIIKRMFGLDETRAPRLGLVLLRSLHLAAEGGLPLTTLPRILTDSEYRLSLLSQTDDVALHRFWEHEFPEEPSAQLAWTASTLTRLETFLDDPAIRRFLGQPRSSFDFRTVMDEGKVIICSLSKGRLGQETSHMLGGFLTLAFQTAAESRQAIHPAEARRPWFCAIEEAQNYVNTRAFGELLAEARGYGVSLIFLHQHLGQLDEDFRRALLGNTKVRVAFRTSSEDSAILAREFFRVTGDRVKDRKMEWVKIGRTPIPIGFKDNYFSVSDEGRQNREWLHYLPDRVMWVHLSGEPAPVKLRTVDMPRREIAASRERAARLRALVYETQAQRQPALPEPGPVAPEAKASRYEWAGRDAGSAATERQGPEL